jgi:PTS system nitrogen regulatory IIA component
VNIDDILTLDRTFCKIDASSRKRALEKVAICLAENQASLNAEQLFSNLIAREKMGSTALGHGIAIPHCRMQGCSDIVGGLFQLNEAIDFDSPDRNKVNLLFVLVVPEEEVSEHLQVLAMLASRFESEGYRQALCSAGTAQELFNAAVQEINPDVKQAHN